MSRPIHVAILGGRGYGAGELLRLLTQHPVVTVVSVTSSSRPGAPLDEVHPHLRGFYDMQLAESVNLERLVAAEHAVVFSALPHGTSAPAIARLLGEGEAPAQPGRTARQEPRPPDGVRERLRVIDLSGDFRLRDADRHREHYPDTPLLPELRERFVYGLPELSRDRIRTARCVANPGCLAAASILAAAPLAEAGFAGTLAIDAKTGSTGSGRELKETTHHPTRHADFRAYKPLAHQHEPEILQALGDPRGQRIQTSFVAQSLDVARGIYVTVHTTLPDTMLGGPAPYGSAGASPSPANLGGSALARRYREFYAGSPFVRIVDEPPALQNVVGANFCDIAVACRGRQVIVMAALDNLVKGMAGAAIQNMNLMCGLAETTGLWAPSFRPA